MMSFSRFLALARTAAKRLFSQWGLTLAMTLGLVASISLILGIQVYADAVYFQTFQGKLAEEGTIKSTITRPPFTFIFHYDGSANGPREWAEVQPFDSFAQNEAADILRLPAQTLVRYVRTEPLPVFSPEVTSYEKKNASLMFSSIGFMSGIAEHIQLLEGSFPAAEASAAGQPVDVLISETAAGDYGIQPGEIYTVYSEYTTTTGAQAASQFRVRVSGIWRATDLKDPYWQVQPRLLETMLLTSESGFSGGVAPALVGDVYSGLWFLGMDGSGVRASDTTGLMARIEALETRAARVLPQVRLTTSPAEALTSYRSASNLLTIYLYAFSVPIIGLILAFIGLVAGLAVDQQRNETAVLRSRGATGGQVILITVLEGLIIGLVALALSLPAALGIARLIGSTRTFLDFSFGSSLPVAISPATLKIGLAAAGIGILARVLPMLGILRHTIVSYAQERARMLRKPWWQRAWLDVLLLIPAVYGAYLLRGAGRVARLENLAGGSLPFQNPLFFLVPALGILALALLFLRVLPPLLELIAWLAARANQVSLLMAARQLSRMPGPYGTPLVVLILTLSMSSYTASLSATLNQSLIDQQMYRTGADLRFTELGESSSSGGAPAGVSTYTSGSSSGGSWYFIPVSDYLQVEGVQAAARVGRYPASFQTTGAARQTGSFLGVDRADFGQVAFWRSDFARENLGGLLNRLAGRPDAVLVPNSLLSANDLHVGDTFQVTINSYGQRTDLDLYIAGSFRLFPSWYSKDGPLLVGNLDYLFEHAGSEFPYQVWLRTDAAADQEQMANEGLRDVGLAVIGWDSARLTITQTQQLPERQGLFGLLFIGFAAAALLTALGFLLYVLFSFRRRSIELGILRASGLSLVQMAGYLVWELLLLILLGGGIGTALGVAVSRMFIPYLQIGSGSASQIPPFQVILAWPALFQIYALFGVLFLVTLAVLVLLLRRMKIFQSIKLGETL